MPLMQLDVIEVGEKTGNLGNSMEDASRTFRNELTKKIQIMTTLVSGGALGLLFHWLHGCYFHRHKYFSDQ